MLLQLATYPDGEESLEEDQGYIADVPPQRVSMFAELTRFLVAIDITSPIHVTWYKSPNLKTEISSQLGLRGTTAPQVSAFA